MSGSASRCRVASDRFFSGERFRVSEFRMVWLQPLKEGKLVLVSACGPSQKRATRDSVRMRNECVLALADSFVIPHASVGGKTETLCREVLKAGKAVWTLNQPDSRNLYRAGGKAGNAGKVTRNSESARKSLAASSHPGD